LDLGNSVVSERYISRERFFEGRRTVLKGTQGQRERQGRSNWEEKWHAIFLETTE